MPFKTGPRRDCHIPRWLLDFVMSKTTPLVAPEKSSIFAHLCRSPQDTDSVSDTIPQAERCGRPRDAPEWKARGVSMTPPPREQLNPNRSGETPPPSCLRLPSLASRYPAGQFPPSIGSLPHQSGTARFGSVGGEGVGGGGVGVGLEDEVAEEGARAPARVWESFPYQ